MGTFLFYLLKSAFCLILFYVFYRALLSRSTFFRFNRLTLLVGMSVCVVLPLMEFTTEEEHLFHTPFQVIHRVLVEEGYSDSSLELVQEGGMGRLANSPERVRHTSPDITFRHELIRVGGVVYLIGSVVVFLGFVLSAIRMWGLILHARRSRYGKYTLALTSQTVGSFSWGRVIVISEADYGHSQEILLHEVMHLRSWHTLDLLWIQLLLILFWFNPAMWLLKRELQEVHEFEADDGVINNGIDATRYQLLLVKKAVGTRLYSMANGFNHSKLKNRITMMLKERTNGWARLKLLLFVPVMAGTLYAFARPEVKETFVQTVPGLHQKQAMDYQTLSKLLRNEEEAYNLRKFGKKVAPTTPENRMNQLLMNARNVMLFDGDYVLKENLKDKVKEKLLYKQRREKEKSGRKDEQIVGFWCDRGTNVDEARQALQAVYDAYTEIRDSIAIASGNDSKDFLDKEFPIVVSQYENLKKFGSQSGDCLSGIELNFMSGKDLLKELKNPTAEELQQAVTDYREKLKDGRKLSVRVKVDRECNMGTVLKMKQILRENW
ncbi:M56 family metallopeptidase [Bacteroides fragilis]|jgi:hypothetical protein|uniref:M56 family metallopeptidase n=2 Tax=Bacteroides TaxID=816 RepID=UPI001C73D14D|nr:M56 family metallopeptidase [Bacteroides fragilis]MCM0250792.1 M56 family metallopeptidase [Bacteroides fragilis]MCM0334911.1 M56 family metallopeptidase [Bacteroides fragilis]